MRLFTNNDELDTHVYLCLSSEAICSARVEDNGMERRKLEVGARRCEEWQEGGSMEGTGHIRTPINARMRVTHTFCTHSDVHCTLYIQTFR